MTAARTLLIEADHQPGVLSQVAGVFARLDVNITSIQTLAGRDERVVLSIEVPASAAIEGLVEDLTELPVVHKVTLEASLQAIYGKRVIIIGGGAQVGQVAMGAVSEADRHNIRGERISVDTIPLVGEEALADAVRAVARLPRARILVLAGSIMGGAITEAVRDLRAAGVQVIALNMVGSVREAADLVVTDPLQAGVMAVMAIADTARFDLSRQRGRTY
jgi:energy-converting hydrogenase B subunit Q